jgi:hypothetical protein
MVEKKAFLVHVIMTRLFKGKTLAFIETTILSTFWYTTL